MISSLLFLFLEVTLWTSNEILEFWTLNRAALEVEKKTRASNLHHERGMEKTIGHLNREIVKLQEELVNVETKARAAVAEAEAEAAQNSSNLSVKNLYL